MKLDDRPVIDQLLNPTPLNILRDVEADMTSWIDSNWESLGTQGQWAAQRIVKMVADALEARL